MNIRCAGQNCDHRETCAVHLVRTGRVEQYKPDTCKRYRLLTGAEIHTLSPRRVAAGEAFAQQGSAKAPRLAIE